MQSAGSLLHSLPLLPSSAAVLLTLMLVSPPEAEAQACEVDPFGAEVCLPDPNPEVPPPDPEDPPEEVVIIIDCFGPCKEFPPPTPYRQYEEVADPEPEPEPEAEPVPEPIRPLWFKSDDLDHAAAEAYLERALRHVQLAQASSSSLNSAAAPIVRADGMSYMEVLEPNTVLISRTVLGSSTSM